MNKLYRDIVIANIKNAINKEIEIQFAKPKDYRFDDVYCKIPLGMTAKIDGKWIDERNYSGDISKAKTELNFIPKVNIDQGIKKTADWFKSIR